ncbi:MAG: FAD-dependent oxidoreductase [Candidatus Nanopelagicaceae bacterium]|nr:FAD-dependent oxidoreductase [Candidatus Nanopelagicaceae bacterium]
MSKKVIVVGAGWAGLNAARVLNDAGFLVKVLEKSDRVGGRITSDYVDGFILDRGFQVINPKYAELKETGVIDSIEINSLPKGLEIRNGLETFRIGDFRGNIGFLSGALNQKLGSVREKLAFLRYLSKKSEDTEFKVAMQDVGDFYKMVLKPFLDGVFLADSDGVSNQMARELIHWFIKGAPGLPSGGVREVSEALAAGLDIEFNVDVKSVSNLEVITSEGSESADAVILATDPISAAAFLGTPAPSMNASQTWYFKAPKGEIASNLLRVGGLGPLVNSVALSNICPDYAPVDSTLVAATNLNRAEESEVRLHLSYLWETSTSDWELIKCYSIPNSLPFHRPGIPLLAKAPTEKGVYLAGDWRATPSQQGALLSGRLAARALISHL